MAKRKYKPGRYSRDSVKSVKARQEGHRDRADKPWTQKDNDHLLNMVMSGVSIRVMCTALDRSVDAITSQIWKFKTCYQYVERYEPNLRDRTVTLTMSPYEKRFILEMLDNRCPLAFISLVVARDESVVAEYIGREEARRRSAQPAFFTPESQDAG